MKRIKKTSCFRYIHAKASVTRTYKILTVPAEQSVQPDAAVPLYLPLSHEEQAVLAVPDA